MGDKIRRFIFLGAPGVGKGTFAKLICKQQNLQHLSIGELLRDHVERQTDLGKQLSPILKSGKLVSDEIVNHIITEELRELQSNQKGFILDGYPRTLYQARYLNTMYSCEKKEIFAVNITLDREVTVAKLLGRVQCRTCGRPFNTANIVDKGFDMPAILPDRETCPQNTLLTECEPIFDRRDDDTAVTIQTRLSEFDSLNQNVLAFYSSRNSLRNFDVHKGIKDVDDLWKLMIK